MSIKSFMEKEIIETNDSPCVCNTPNVSLVGIKFTISIVKAVYCKLKK